MTDHDAKTPEGYTCDGTHTILGRGRDGFVIVFVAQATMSGRPWLRYVRKIDDPSSWYVTAYKSKREAVDSWRRLR